MYLSEIDVLSEAAPACPADATPVCDPPDSAAANCFRQAHAARWCAPGAPGSATCAPLAAPRAITRVVIHTVANPSMTAIVNRTANAAGGGTSAHYYVFRNGCIVQMVREANVAFHAGNPPLNRNSIGIEHADVCNDPAPYTRELYERSAALVRDIRARHRFPLRVFGIHTANRNDATVIAHSDIFPGHHGDPGPYWDWEYYTKLLQWDGRAATRPVRLVAMAAMNPATPTGWDARRRAAIANDHCAPAGSPYGGTFWAGRANTAGNDIVSRFTLSLPGLYKVSLWWPRVAGANARAMVSVEVIKGGGPARANGVFDQTRNAGRWNDLGQPFTFDVPGGGAKVSVRLQRRSPAPGLLLADAVRVLRVS
jgi:hypothetical protein